MYLRLRPVFPADPLAIIGGLMLLLPPLAPAASPPLPDLVACGKYIFGAAGGCGCHTEPGKPLNSGRQKDDGPFGTGYSASITPD